jgi:hypothetical protein
MITATDAPVLGRVLDSAVIQKGLRELNPDFAFDVAVNRPSDFTTVIAFASTHVAEAIRKNRLPVLHCERYIAALDRGLVTETKHWSVANQLCEVPWYEADKDDVSIQYHQIMPGDPEYMEYYLKAMLGNDPAVQVIAGGTVVRQRCMAYRKVRGRVIRLGWRHTFERILNAEIPGVTRKTLGEKFRVDLMTVPVGPMDELIAELVEE